MPPTDLPLILIGAMTQDRVIGQDDHMPWDIPEEYQTFVDNIRGQTVIMGRKSYEIFGPDLTSEHTIVISRGNPGIQVPIAHGTDDALALARTYGKTIFVAGGSQVYEMFLPLADQMYLSEIKENHPGNRYFPEFDRGQWEVDREDDHAQFVYREWRRVR